MDNENKRKAICPYTKNQVKVMKKAALTKLVKQAGGRTHLSRMLGVPVATVNSWIDRGMISRGGAEKVANHEAFNYSVYDLRIDLMYR